MESKKKKNVRVRVLAKLLQTRPRSSTVDNLSFHTVLKRPLEKKKVDSMNATIDQGTSWSFLSPNHSNQRSTSPFCSFWMLLRPRTKTIAWRC